MVEELLNAIVRLAFDILSTLLFFVFMIVLSRALLKVFSSEKKGRLYGTVSSDGHKVSEDEDLTCETKDGHRHETNPEFGRRYIVHNEPNTGYVVLNGKLMKIEDCKDL